MIRSRKHLLIGIVLAFPIFFVLAVFTPLYYRWILPIYLQHQFSSVSGMSPFNVERMYKDISPDGTEISWFYKDVGADRTVKNCKVLHIPTHRILSVRETAPACLLTRRLSCSNGSGALTNIYVDIRNSALIITYEVSRSTKYSCSRIANSG